jgi:5'-3' exonuclease
MTLKEAEQWGKDLAETQRDIMFQLGDLYRYCEAKFGDEHTQAWPEWISPGMLQRAGGVCRAYPTEGDRQHEATYSQYMQNAGRADRQERLGAVVDKGLTTDESRKANSEELPMPERRWILCIDVNYWVTRMWASGAETEAAKEVAGWIKRLVERLKEKGLTDVVCCLDSSNSFRKELTKGWDEEDRYKNRATKDPELGNQLRLAEEMLSEFCCAKLDGFEADDFMASYAKQFNGRVTLLTVDKDMRQCLSSKCNMLVDVEWSEDPTSGDMLPDYKWISAKNHLEGCTYNGTSVVGISPEQWTTFQSLAGDSSDNIAGAVGIGAKIAADLVKQFGTVAAVIQAAKDGDERIKAKKRESLIEFEARHEVTRQLVTLRTDLQIPTTTKI